METEIDFLESSMEIFGNCAQVTEEINIEPSPSKPLRKKRKMVKDWEEGEIYKLISLIENERCLWDASDEAYHNKQKRDIAWKSIEDHFKAKYNVSDLSVKWTNLRIQFRGYAGRAKTKSGQGTVESPKWRFYSAMSFVGRAEDEQTQQTVSNIINLDDNSSSKSSEADTPAPPKPKKLCNISAQSAATQIAETMREAVTAMKERKTSNDDPNITFATYLVSELKTLNPESGAGVRNRVTMFFLQCLDEERSQ